VSKEDIPEQKLQRYGQASCRAAVRTAVVAGVFCLLVSGLLADNYFRGEVLRREMLGTPQQSRLASLRAAVVKSPQDRKLRDKVHSYDLALRKALVRNARRARQGGWLLLGGSAVFLTALLYAAAFRKKLPAPPKPGPHGEGLRLGARARWSVGAAAAVLLIAGIMAGLSASGPPPGEGRPPADPARQWPRFRGPGGLGISACTNVARKWDGTTGENILWKTPVPLPGQNSPVVWEDRVFLSGANKTRREVYCFDANTGEMLWKRPVENVPGTPEEPPQIDNMTGYAAPTMATDGRRVYAMFVNGDLAAFDFVGRRLWAENFDTTENMYGHAASLTTYGPLLIIQLDRGKSADEAKSQILALKGASGELVWKTEDRPVKNSWSSPIIIRAAKEEQIIACGSPWIIAYNAATGAEIWRAKAFEEDIDVAPSPVYAGGLVIACNTGSRLVGIRPDGRGDVTGSHIAYRTGEYMPDIASPLSNGDLTFLVNGPALTCHDAKTGKLLWEHEFEDSFYSSPSLVGDLVYMMDAKGVMHIFKADNRRKYEPVGQARLGEKASTCPAFVNGRIFIRGEKHLFCIGNTDDSD